MEWFSIRSSISIARSDCAKSIIQRTLHRDLRRKERLIVKIALLRSAITQPAGPAPRWRLLAFVQRAELGSWRLLFSNPAFITVIRGPLACSDSRGAVAAALQKNRRAKLQNDFRAGELRYDRNSTEAVFARLRSTSTPD